MTDTERACQPRPYSYLNSKHTSEPGGFLFPLTASFATKKTLPGVLLLPDSLDYGTRALKLQVGLTCSG
jgi:hypothetical protein